MLKKRIYHPNNIYLRKNTLLNLLILFISTIYGITVGSGFYGYNSDFYAEYSRNNIIYYIIFDGLGYLLSTLTIFGKHIGVYILSFLLSIASGFIIKKFFVLKNLNSILNFTILYLIILHIHPIIMSTSGAMRQGWTMSLVYLSIILYTQKNYNWSFLFIFISIFTHRSGLIFLIIYFFTIINLKILPSLNKYREIYIFFSGIIFFVISYVYFNYKVTSASRIVAGDFRYAWLLINIVYLFSFITFFKFYNNSNARFVPFFLYYFSFFVPVILFVELNYHYERLNMMMGIIYFFVLGLVLEKRIYKIYLFIIFIGYLFLTIFQGMYTQGLV